MTNTNSRTDKNRDRVVSGPIIKTILSLSWPVMVGMFMEFALTITDFFWVGKLGTAAQDAITTSMVAIWTVFSVLSLISIGLTALVARHIGAGNKSKAIYFTRQGLALALILSGVITIAGYFLAPLMVSFMEAGEATAALALPYLRIFLFSVVFFALSETAYATFRATGDTRTPTIIGTGAIVANMILDPLLIFGYGFVPAFGVPGASLASAIAIAGAAGASIYVLSKGKSGLAVKNPLLLSPRFKSILRIMRIGVPMASQQLVFVVVYWFLIKIVHQFGESAGAAMGIGNRMESFSYLVTYGISLASSTMVGQNLGAGKPDRAAKCAWGAVSLGFILTSIISLIFLLFPKGIASIFSSDPEVLSITNDYLIILALSQTTMAIEIILEGSFSGAGNTLPPMLVGIPGSIARIPLAYFLAFELDWGINGVWWTLTITTVIKSTILALWFMRGRWKTRKI